MKNLWNKWTKVAEKIGNVQIIVIFSVLYFLLVIPWGLVMRLNYDFFNNKSLRWHKMKDDTSSLEKLGHQ